MKPCILHLLIFFLLLSISSQRVQATGETDSIKSFLHGRETFRTYCSACHSVHKEIIGPMLGSITKKRTQEWLVHFIKNSQEVITSGDEYAKHLYEQYNQTVMPSFNSLSDDEINNILFYIKTESLYPQEKLDDDTDALSYSNSEVLKGKQIFQNQCSPCHFIEKENSSEGPALGSVNKRRPHEWLVPFIKNSQQVIKSGDPYAVYLYNSFDRRIMVPMEFLSTDDINAVLNYIGFVSSSTHAEAGINGRTALNEESEKLKNAIINVTPSDASSKPFFKVFFIVVASLGAIVHALLIARLFNYLNKEKGR